MLQQVLEVPTMSLQKQKVALPLRNDTGANLQLTLAYSKPSQLLMWLTSPSNLR